MAWGAIGVWWVAAVVVAAMTRAGVELPWWVGMLREPVTVGGVAAVTVAMVMWHTIAAGPSMLEKGIQIGREAAQCGQHDNGAGNVLPLQGRRSRAELS